MSKNMSMHKYISCRSPSVVFPLPIQCIIILSYSVFLAESTFSDDNDVEIDVSLIGIFVHTKTSYLGIPIVIITWFMMLTVVDLIANECMLSNNNESILSAVR